MTHANIKYNMLNGVTALNIYSFIHHTRQIVLVFWAGMLHTLG